jgi:hypothetical protein
VLHLITNIVTFGLSFICFRITIRFSDKYEPI